MSSEPETETLCVVEEATQVWLREEHEILQRQLEELKSRKKNLLSLIDEVFEEQTTLLKQVESWKTQVIEKISKSISAPQIKGKKQEEVRNFMKSGDFVDGKTNTKLIVPKMDYVCEFPSFKTSFTNKWLNFPPALVCRVKRLGDSRRSRFLMSLDLKLWGKLTQKSQTKHLYQVNFAMTLHTKGQKENGKRETTQVWSADVFSSEDKEGESLSTGFDFNQGVEERCCGVFKFRCTCDGSVIATDPDQIILFLEP